MTIVQIPSFLRDLRTQWSFSSVKSPFLESALRKGCMVTFPRQMDFKSSFSSMPFLCVLETGGAGTVCAESISFDDAKMIRLAQVKQYVLSGSYATFMGIQKSSLFLEKLCSSRNCLVKYQSTGGRVDSALEYFPDAQLFVSDLLSLLPSFHMGDSFFHTLIIGGGGGATKYGCYEDGTVQIYDSSLGYSLRNLCGITLHEIGHSLHARGVSQSPRFVSDMQDISKMIGQNGVSDSFVVDYLGGLEERFNRAQIDVSEFVAESYLWYVANGMKMKNSPLVLHRDLYSLIRDQFGGIEYE